MATQSDAWALIDPHTPLPCALGVVAPVDRVAEIRSIQKEAKLRRYLVRAILSDHIPLAGSMASILARPGYHMMEVNGESLTIYLHHGGRNAVLFDLVGGQPTEALKYIEVQIESQFPSNCFWSARTAVSQLLDSMMRTAWLPLTIRRLDLFLGGDSRPLCHQLILPFTDGVRWGPLGGIHQMPVLVAYEALIREAITTGSPFYRLLCGHRLYEGLQPLRKTIRELGEKFGIAAQMPKPPTVDLEFLQRVGFTPDFLEKIKNAEDFWKESAILRHAAAHFLLDDSSGPISLSDGPTYYIYSLVGAVLLQYSHQAFRELSGHVSKHFGDRLSRGSILPMIERRDEFVLKPDN
jgi:hypothetical protein